MTHISELTGIGPESVKMQDIFVFDQTGVAADNSVLGDFAATGIRPKFANKLKVSGIVLPPDIFEQRARVSN